MEVSMQYYDKKDVGERIKVLRKRKHLTQSELSECLDYIQMKDNYKELKVVKQLALLTN